LDDFDLPRAGNIARKKSAALVFLKADSGEEYIQVDGNVGDRWVFSVMSRKGCDEFTNFVSPQEEFDGMGQWG